MRLCSGAQRKTKYKSKDAVMWGARFRFVWFQRYALWPRLRAYGVATTQKHSNAFVRVLSAFRLRMVVTLYGAKNNALCMCFCGLCRLAVVGWFVCKYGRMAEDCGRMQTKYAAKKCGCIYSRDNYALNRKRTI